jgi:hypothetical protein
MDGKTSTPHALEVIASPQAKHMKLPMEVRFDRFMINNWKKNPGALLNNRWLSMTGIFI